MKLLVRHSDNVLEEDDYPVRRIEVRDGVIVGVEDIHKGVYSTDGMPDVGWGLDQVVEWSSYDPTGNHPEQYNEIKAQTDDRYSSVYDRDQLDEVTQRAKREVE